MTEAEFKPIETTYKGWHTRSRLEARWMVYFDAAGMRFDYEREGFELPSGWYLPDFWLPEEETWAEVKGQAFSEEQIQLCRELALATHKNCLLLDGVPDCRTYAGWMWNHDELRQGSAVVVQELLWLDAPPTTPPEADGVLWVKLPLAQLETGMISFYRLKTFVHAARAARFEHGAVQPYNWSQGESSGRNR